MKRALDSSGASVAVKRPRPEPAAPSLVTTLRNCEGMDGGAIDAALRDFYAIQDTVPLADRQAVVLAVLGCMESKPINWQRLYNVVMGALGYTGSEYSAEQKEFLTSMARAAGTGYQPLSFLVHTLGDALAATTMPDNRGQPRPVLPDVEELYDSSGQGFMSESMLNNPDAAQLVARLMALGAEEQDQVDYFTDVMISEFEVVPLPLLLVNSRGSLLDNLRRILEYIPVDQVPYALQAAAKRLNPTANEVKVLLDKQVSEVGRVELNIPFLSIFGQSILGTRPLFLYALLVALEGGHSDMVEWLLREQRDTSVYADRKFLQLREKHPELTRAARDIVPLQYLVPRTLGRLRNIERRKYRERITQGDLVYKWDDVCAGKTDAAEEELLGYAIGITLILNDLKGVDEAERDIADRLEGQLRGAGTTLRRAVCKYIAEATDEYRAIVATMNCPLITEERVQDIPLGQLITWVEGGGAGKEGQRYCFTTNEMAQMDSNPFHRGPIPEGARDKAARYQQAYGEWHYDRNEAAREEFMRDARVYSALWELLNTGYPVSQSAYKALSAADVLELDADVRVNGRMLSRAAALEPSIRGSPDPHLALARKLLEFIGDNQDDDFGSKVLLVNQLLSDYTNDESVGVEAGTGME